MMKADFSIRACLVENLNPFGCGRRKILSILIGGVAATAFARPAFAQRDLKWAEPAQIDGVPNLHRVTPLLYRSAQPNGKGLEALAHEVNLKTVVSFRAFHSDEKLLPPGRMTFRRIPIETWDIDEDEVIEAMRAVLVAMNQGPVLVHCQHGADRTGMIVALYRSLYQGWSMKKAMAEMMHGGFGYHTVWANIPRYLRNVDLATLRDKIG